MFSVLAGLIFLVGFFAHLGLTMRYVLTQRSLGLKPERGTLAWNAFHGAMLLALTIWGFMRIIDGNAFAPLAPLPTAPAIATLSYLTLRRADTFAWLRGLPVHLRHRMEWGLLIAVGFLAMSTIEWPWSVAFGLFGPTYWWLEVTLVLLAVLCFYLVGRRYGAAVIPVILFCAFIGVAQYFVRKFKNAAILPNDLLALGTAAAVSDQYTYSIDPKAVLGCALICATLYVLSLLHPSWSVQADDKARGLVRRDAGMGLASAALCAALVLVPNYMKVFQVQIMYWYSISYYEKQGFLPTFIAVWQDMPIHKPEGYTTEEAEKTLRQLSQSYLEGAGSSETLSLPRPSLR